MKKTKVADLEKIAAEYHLNEEVKDKFIEDLCQEHCCDWLSELIFENDRVVELGFGEGITLRRLAPKSHSYTLVEGAPSLAEVARAKHPNVKVVCSMFEDFQPLEKFDKLLALHVFEHVDDPVGLARHLRTWLKPNGELIAVVPNRASLHRRLAVNMKIISKLDALNPRDYMVGHKRVYDLSTLEQDLRNSGFEPIGRRGFFFKPLPNSLMLNFPSEMIVGLNLLGDELPVDMMANIAVRARLSS